MEQKRKILVVDDATTEREILSFHLTQKGYEVLQAKDGLEGLKMMEQTPPDLMVLDINMPKMNGLEVYNKLLVEKKLSRFPIIIMTTRTELGTLFKDLNVDGFINKPLNAVKVLEEIGTVMRKRYAPTEAATISAGATTLKKKIEGTVKVLIVDDNKEHFREVLLEFASAGFSVSYAKDGLDAIEKLMGDLPHIILVKLGLSGLAGDVIIAKLKNMPRTMDIPCLLYTQYSGTLDPGVIEKIRSNTKTDLLETHDPATLLKEVRKALGL